MSDEPELSDSVSMQPGLSARPQCAGGRQYGIQLSELDDGGLTVGRQKLHVTSIDGSMKFSTGDRQSPQNFRRDADGREKLG
jgi:hypothetical protein